MILRTCNTDAGLTRADDIFGTHNAMHILTDLGDDAFTIIAQPAAPTTVAR